MRRAVFAAMLLVMVGLAGTPYFAQSPSAKPTAAPAASAPATATAPVTLPKDALLKVTYSEGNKALIPFIRPEPGRQWQHKELLKQVTKRKGDVDLLFVGDSITQGWSDPAGLAVWKKYYAAPELKALNLGVSGDRIEHAIWLMQNGELEGLDPKVTVILIGINSIQQTRTPAAHVAEGIAALINEIHSRCPRSKFLLLGVFPSQTRQNAARTAVAETNKLIAKYDDGKTIRFLDFGDKFLDADGELPKSLMPDRLHPNAAGYEIWATNMNPLLSEMLGVKIAASQPATQGASGISQ